MSSRILVVGATSAIGRALATRLASQGRALLLAGRDGDELDRIVADLRVRFRTKAEKVLFDAYAFERYRDFFAACAPTGDALDGVVLCHGDTVDGGCDGAPEAARRLVDVNFTSAVALFSLATPYFEERRRGFLCAIGSVAGDRGRKSNYLYGAAKGALALYLQGLRQRLAKVGVPVLLVKPGFVDTAMTFGRPGLFLVATPERVAKDIAKALSRRKDVLYTPWFWRWIMLIIRTIPEGLFKRLSL